MDEFIRERARQRGAVKGLEFAESFRTFRLKDDPATDSTGGEPAAEGDVDEASEER